MHASRRLASVAAALATAMLALGGAACGSTEDATSTTGDTSTSTGDATVPETTRYEFTVADGTRTDGASQVEIPLGTSVALTVTADTADELHVHGYDLTADTVPGQPASIEFVADLPGVFEVELHQAGTVVTQLRVTG
ncbi:hypothetical protein HT102_13940 [Hoyosella sp. G463]|uniref:EfeO-type cupredoxin-like domain-containing protein n=1 Tax=Lolliginicoccus lacisalsi TaxID=2742202 RepID=A0A927JE40_9ACTN|nr:hypothetical protein [Lolliginicoccus lacisalsi]MBD8507584.1 hypothetical protein [Lolliginicoccus lacisalsi]